MSKILERIMTDEKVVINAPVDEVFRHFTQIDRWPKWTTAIKSAKALSRGQWRKGYFISFTPKAKGLPPLPLPVTILEYEPNHRIAWGIKLPISKIVHEFTFKSLPDGRTEVHNKEWSAGGFTLAMAPVARAISQFNHQMASDLAEVFA